MQIGFTELLLIIFLIIALFKPSKLKELATQAGTIYRQAIDLKQDINDSISDTNTCIKEERSNNPDENRIS